ncbi:MAG TPA: hypothetical protein VLW25_07530 [Bryobacteraceae bacterium]|nr:hypothetical protein [Bryobacteraceae bacterium]
MHFSKRAVAAGELLLVFPAALFMTAAIARSLQPIEYEPARTAQRIFDWYGARPHISLWVLLIALPLAVVVSGCVSLVHSWSEESQLREAARQTIAAVRAHLATLLVAVATLTAGGILAFIVLHLLTG